MEVQLQVGDLPFVGCDFNACGWAGNGDRAYYVLNQEQLIIARAEVGQRVFLYDSDEPGTILGCIAVLEHVRVGGFSGWRAQPVKGTDYHGPVPAHLAQQLGA